ncbi:MAG: ThuA domain-containing protein [Isosphaeraceae bacterium]|nr:ThuA domain-containing protein [Isosphaeraceae bacterium]
MSSTIHRRRWLFQAGAGLLTTSIAGSLLAAPAKKKILFFTKSAGFEHSVIKLGPGGKPSHADKILTEIAKDYDVVCSKDGRLFDPDKIGEFDAFVFETTGDLTKEGTDKTPPMSKEGEQAFYDAIKSGKGFVGLHCATDTFGHHRGKGADDPYIQLIGGEFISHGPQQNAKLRVADKAFPGAKSFGGGDSFEITDEWYSLININPDLHVIYAQVCEGMNGWEYDRPDFPQTWARMHGKGRVFYSSMGHREDVWANEKFQGMLLGGLDWATGKVDADVKPNIESATPGYAVVPKRPLPQVKKKAAAKKKA